MKMSNSETAIPAPKANPADRFDERALRKAFGKFPTGVAVVTANGAGGPIGITVNSFSTVSMEPVLLSWAISRNSSRYQTFSQANIMSIHILAQHQSELCKSFSRNARAFDRHEWRENNFGIPVFDDVVARFDVKTIREIPAGDHVIFLTQLLAYETSANEPLIFCQGKLDAFNAKEASI